MKTKTHIYILILSIFVLLASCKSEKNQNPNRPTVISLAPSITKMICHLECMDNLVGVTDFCSFDTTFDGRIQSGLIQRICGFNSFNYEKLISLEPDLIFYLDSITLEEKLHLEKLFANTKTQLIGYFHPNNFDEIKDQFCKIASFLNATDKAAVICQEIDNKLSLIQPLEKTVLVLPQIYYPPFTSVGKNTYIADIIRHSGGTLAIESDENWPVIPLEKLISTEIHVIIADSITNDKNLLLIDAYKDNRIFVPSNQEALMQPGLECVDLCLELNEYLKGM